MTKQEQNSLKKWFEQYIKRFRDDNRILPTALDLKYRHSQRVAENARLIAQKLELAPEEILLAEGCGLVHDIGRFPQYIRYGSFHDAVTVDHGQEGRKTLENEQIPKNFDVDDWEHIACAVEYHNKKVSDIPTNLKDSVKFFLRLIRDADKLDIMDLVMKAVAIDGFGKLSDMLPHISTDRKLTPGVLEEILKTKTVSVDNLRTLTDFVAMLASWFYDFNYAPTRALAADRHILERIEHELPNNKDIRKLLTDMKKKYTSLNG
ncbi:MAG: HD domain-containing protein [Syntrophaceae bacterium]|nr:HD domain-containing protein [Syntrophaceae bacterium]